MGGKSAARCRFAQRVAHFALAERYSRGFPTIPTIPVEKAQIRGRVRSTTDGGAEISLGGLPLSTHIASG
jgi:hypothetical protein